LKSVALAAALVAVLAGCGGKRIVSPDKVSACMYEHGGAATRPQDVASETRGIPGRAVAVLEFTFPERTGGVLTNGAVFFERTDHDAELAYRALRHFDVTVPKVPGVSLKKFPRLDLVKSGQLERHDRTIVLWFADRSERSARTTLAVSTCLNP
jgi:hypothetical protein